MMQNIFFIFDVDGVLIRGREKDGQSWAKDLQADLGISIESLAAHFFEKDFHKALVGEKTLDETLRAAMEKIGHPEKTEMLIEYWLRNDNGLNKELLSYLKQKKSGNAPLILATNQEHTRARYIWEKLNLKEYFDHMIYSAKVGHAKPEDAFFEALENTLKTGNCRKLYVDDSPKNIAAAEKRGWECHLFKDNDLLFRWMNAKLENEI